MKETSQANIIHNTLMIYAVKHCHICPDHVKSSRLETSKLKSCMSFCRVTSQNQVQYMTNRPPGVHDETASGIPHLPAWIHLHVLASHPLQAGKKEQTSSCGALNMLSISTDHHIIPGLLTISALSMGRVCLFHKLYSIRKGTTVLRESIANSWITLKDTPQENFREG